MREQRNVLSKLEAIVFLGVNREDVGLSASPHPSPR
jgi:hypothetical protein